MGGPPIREGGTTLEESYCALASMGLLTSIIDTHTKKKNEVGTAGLLRGARGFESGDPKYVCGTNDLTAECVSDLKRPLRIHQTIDRPRVAVRNVITFDSISLCCCAEESQVESVKINNRDYFQSSELRILEGKHKNKPTANPADVVGGFGAVSSGSQVCRVEP